MKKQLFSALFVTLCLVSFALQARSPDTSIDLIKSAIVFIATEESPFDQYYRGSYFEYLRPLHKWFWPSAFFQGSGFIISPDGYIVTNAHVINGATDIRVIMQDSKLRMYKASIIGSDLRTDIAVLKLENEDNISFPYLMFGDSDATQVGEQIFIGGTPWHEAFESTFTMGIVSAKNRNNFLLYPVEGYIQVDAFMGTGNSGGPVINLEGDVIGVNAFSYRPARVISQPLSFAIPSYTAEHIALQLIAKGEVSQGFLGVEMEKITISAFDQFYFDAHEGAVITRIIENSPAATSGLEVGDVVLEINQIRITSPQDLRNRVSVLEPDTEVDLLIQRGEDIFSISLKLESEALLKKHALYSKLKWVI